VQRERVPPRDPLHLPVKEYTAVITESTGVIAPITENIPEQLTERPQWVCWRLERRNGEPTKVPYTPGTERRASSTDLMTWRTFEEALAAYEAGEPPYDGIGFMFCSADPFVGIDIDGCRDPESGEVAAWAQRVITRVQEGYVEASPSGTGVHIIVEGGVRDGGRSRRKVRAGDEVVGELEMYSRERFFTITGVLL
jgi:putative DNA primase/helicase